MRVLSIALIALLSLPFATADSGSTQRYTAAGGRLASAWILLALLAVATVPAVVGATAPTPLDQGLLGAKAVASGHSVYLFGGALGPSLVPTAAVISYDLDTRVGRQIPATLPTPRYHVAAIGTDPTHVLVIGGNEGSTHARDILSFDTTSETFRTLGELPYGVSDAAIAALNDRVLLAGGEIDCDPTPCTDLTDRILEINPVSGVVKEAGFTLPARIAGAASKSQGGTLEIVGGLEQSPNGVAPTANIRAHPTNADWTTGTQLPNALAPENSWTEQNGALYVAGGMTGGRVSDAIIEVADATAPRIIGHLKAPRQEAAVVSINSTRIMLFGGAVTTPSDRANVVELAVTANSASVVSEGFPVAPPPAKTVEFPIIGSILISSIAALSVHRRR